jgi:hypothetical protein
MSAALELLISKAFDDYPAAHKLPLGSSWVAAKDENNMIHALGLVGAHSLDKAAILNAYAPHLRDFRPFDLSAAPVPGVERDFFRPGQVEKNQREGVAGLLIVKVFCKGAPTK